MYVHIFFYLEQKDRLKKLLAQPKRVCKRKEVTCQICGKKLIGTSSLNRHIQNIHPRQNNNEKLSARDKEAGSNPEPRPSGRKWKSNLSQQYNNTQKM